jgi:type VI secretion system protein ImpJ
MRSLSQVVWSEGMYLGPHEFQGQARYFEDSIHFATSALWFQAYGLTGCILDAEALRNGTVSLVHASGILPDGMPFHMPQCDPLPAARQIAELFPPTRDSLMLFLGIGERKAQGRNCTLNGATGDTRYSSELRSFNDETTGIDARPIQVRRKNTRLLLETEVVEGMVSLPLARIRRDGSGHFIFDPDFVPPCLQISASERLMLLLRRLIEILEMKSEALSRLRAESSRSNDFSPRDIANFWLMHAANSGLAALQHLWISKRGHPEELFLEMSRLAGALCTFALDSHPRSLPAYDPQRLGECFAALDQHIRTHLEMLLPTNCLKINLQKVAECFYEGDVQDARCFGRSRWILGIRAGASEAELIARAPQLVKICSAKFVGELVKRALAGLALTYLPVPPPAISARLESQYFSIAKEGPFWDHLAQTKRVGVYVPVELPEAELELLVIIET